MVQKIEDANGRFKIYIKNDKEYLIVNPIKARVEALKAFEKWREKPANLGTDVHYGLQAHFDKSVTINSSNFGSRGYFYRK